MGFGAEIHNAHERLSDNILRQLRPEDLLKYGLIPEFVGRLPVMVALDPLDESALVSILSETRWSSSTSGSWSWTA